MRYSLLIFFIVFSMCSYAQCVGDETFVLSPSGPYQPGDVVTVTYTLGAFTGINVNWIHAFQINLGVGWTNLIPISAPGNPFGSIGNWLWDLQNTYPGGFNFGPGWRFVNTGTAGWGTSSDGPFTMSFQVTVAQTCTPDNLSISMEVFDDCTTGGWSNGDCCSDPALSIYDGSVNLSSSLNSGSDTSIVYCSESNQFNLFDFLGNNVQNDGFWTPSLSDGYLGVFNPNIDSPQEYVYTVSDGCNSESSSVFLNLEDINAGTDYNLEMCIDDDALNLYDLIGNPDIDGVWSPSLNAGYLGYFDPSLNFSGVYTYNVSGECGTDQSQVNVSIIEVVPPPIITN